MSPTVPYQILQYYQATEEMARLQRVESELELLRTREILQRFLPPCPAEVLDVGGGAGVHAFWLADLGYRTHLLDLIPKHIQQADGFNRNAGNPLTSLSLGDARHLPFVNESLDAVLLLGPLYHLLHREEHLQALREAHRVLLPGGTLIAQGISRYSALVKVLTRQLLEDAGMRSVARDTTMNGCHCPHPEQDFFTTAYFHHPLELRNEIVQAGFEHHALLAVEGPARLAGVDFVRHWQDSQTRAWLMEMVRSLEAEPYLLGISSHLMAVATKPGMEPR